MFVVKRDVLDVLVVDARESKGALAGHMTHRGPNLRKICRKKREDFPRLCSFLPSQNPGWTDLIIISII